jgi:hypothetical protein
MNKILLICRNILQGIVSILLSLIMIAVTPVVFIAITLMAAFQKYFYCIYVWWFELLWVCLSMQMVGTYDD